MPRASERWVLAATILGSSLVFVDSTVVNVALPAIQRAFDATVADLQWVVEAYALVLAALLLVGGALGDQLGRRRVFLAGNTLFALASLACGLAPTVELLVLARAVQGVGGALLAPSSLAIITASFADEEARGRAIGTWAGFSSITAAAGPLLGGWLVDAHSWRLAFLINPPLAVLVAWITLRHVPESRADPGRPPQPIDWPGAAAAIVLLGALVFGLVTAGAQGFGRPEVHISLATAAAALVFFVWRERTARAPMVPFRLFRSRSFTGANVLTLLLYAALNGLLFFFPLIYQQVHGRSATASGAAVAPFAVILFAMSRWAGGLVHRVGARLPLVIGPSITAVGFVLFALPGIGGSYWTTFFPAICTVGVGMGITVAPLTTTVMTSVERRHAGLASGINNAVSRVAAVLAIAAFGAVAVASFGAHLDERLAQAALPAQAADEMRAHAHALGATGIPAGLAPAQHEAAQRAVDESFVEAFRIVCAICAALALGSAVLAGAILERRHARTSAPEPPEKEV